MNLIDNNFPLRDFWQNDFPLRGKGGGTPLTEKIH